MAISSSPFSPFSLWEFCYSEFGISSTDPLKFSHGFPFVFVFVFELFLKYHYQVLLHLQFGIEGSDYLESYGPHAKDLGTKHGGVFDTLYIHHNVVKSLNKTRGRGMTAVRPCLKK